MAATKTVYMVEVSWINEYGYHVQRMNSERQAMERCRELREMGREPKMYGVRVRRAAE